MRKRDLRVKAHKLELERLADEQAYKAEERRASLLAERVREAALYEETNREERMRENERLSQLENMMKVRRCTATPRLMLCDYKSTAEANNLYNDYSTIHSNRIVYEKDVYCYLLYIDKINA